MTRTTKRLRGGAGRWTAAALSLALLCGGCGTTANLCSDEPEYYGGLAIFVPQKGGFLYGFERLVYLLGLPFFLADIPLSIAGDTLTLPVVGVIKARGHQAQPTCEALVLREATLDHCGRLRGEDEAFCPRHPGGGLERGSTEGASPGYPEDRFAEGDER